MTTEIPDIATQDQEMKPILLELFKSYLHCRGQDPARAAKMYNDWYIALQEDEDSIRKLRSFLEQERIADPNRIYATFMDSQIILEKIYNIWCFYYGDDEEKKSLNPESFVFQDPDPKRLEKYWDVVIDITQPSISEESQAEAIQELTSIFLTLFADYLRQRCLPADLVQDLYNSFYVEGDHDHLRLGEKNWKRILQEKGVEFSEKDFIVDRAILYILLQERWYRRFVDGFPLTEDHGLFAPGDEIIQSGARAWEKSLDRAARNLEQAPSPAALS
jgi:hypothetical protein